VESALGAPFIEVPPSDRTNYDGTTANFSVYAPGTGPLYYQWRKNAVNLPGATNSTLVLNKVQSGDMGQYSVTVSNLFGVRTSNAGSLTVWLRPVPLLDNGNFGFHGNQFGFDITGPEGQTVVIEASYNLPFWIATGTNILGPNPVHFSDPYSVRVPHRLYRLRVQEP